jgi:hypothetical protein
MEEGARPDDAVLVRRRLRIGIVGGIDRAMRDLQRVALAGGHDLETHTGVVRGGASVSSLRALVARADLVLVLTDVNSHNAVHIARGAARLNQRPLHIMRRLSASQLAAFLDGLPSNEPPRTDRQSKAR